MGDQALTNVNITSGVISGLTNFTVDNININDNAINCTSGNLAITAAGGIIGFGNENLSTAGNISGNNVTVSGILTSDDLTGIYTADAVTGSEKVQTPNLQVSSPPAGWTMDGDWYHEDSEYIGHKEIAWTGDEDTYPTMATAVEDTKKYRVIVEFQALSISNGGITVSLGGVDKTDAANGLNSWDITATNTDGLVINIDVTNGNTNVELMEVSVKEITPAFVTNIEIGNAVSGVYSDTYINKDGGDTYINNLIVDSDIYADDDIIAGDNLIASLGEVGTPSHTFINDLNTGMWSSAADVLNFSAGGVEILELDSTEATFGTDVDIRKSGRFHPNLRGVSSDGLIIYLPMHGDANDYSGNGNDGTISGTPATVAGKFGSALDFNGTTDWITIPDSPSMDIDAVTVIMWIKTSAYNCDGGRKWGAGGTREWTINIDISNQAVFSISTDGTDIHSAIDSTDSVSVSDGKLHLLMGTYDGETVRIYVDGELKDSNTTPSGNLWNNTNNINIAGPAYIRDNAFDGVMSTFKVYGRALSAEEGTSYYESNRELVVNSEKRSFGSCYGNHIGWSQASAVQNTWYNISDSDMLTGNLHRVTHDGNGKLTIVKAGHYLIGWGCCFEDDVANDHIEVGIEVSGGGTAEGDGQGHLENKFASEQEHLSSSLILYLDADDTIEVAIRTTDAVTPTISVQAVNLTCKQISGI